MGLIPENIISDVADRTDMLQVIGEYVTLKRAGRTYKGLCPFHGEKTPSFNVNPERGFFKCFGCGASGNVFTFLTQIEGWSFPEAVRHLAGRVGIDIPETSSEDADRIRARREEKERYQSILGLARRWFEENLWGGRFPEAQRYLQGRGVDEEAARAFGLGFAPDSWSGLLDAMRRRKVSPKECEDAGLAIMGSRGHYDRFRGRLMFPVIDIWGHTLAFSGRTIEAEASGAKYINSPETRFYTKGSEVFGLATTKKAIRSENAALLVEGNFDVVTLYARGVQNVVAPLGTALTERQARLLGRYTQRVYVAFDGDKAGQTATERSLPIFLGQGLDARVVPIPKGEDPDSLVASRGQEALTQAIDVAQPIVAWALDRLLRPVEGAPIEEQTVALAEAGQVLQHIQDPLAHKHYVEEIARRMGLSPQDVSSYIRRTAGRKQSAPSSPSPSSPPSQHPSAGQSAARRGQSPRGQQSQRGQSSRGQSSQRGSQSQRGQGKQGAARTQAPQARPASRPQPAAQMPAPPARPEPPPPEAMGGGGGLEEAPPWLDMPPPEMMGPPPDAEMMDPGPPEDWQPAGAPMEEAGPPMEGFEEEVRAPYRPQRINHLEGFCLQILTDLPDKLDSFIEERFCDLLEDERLVYLLERTWSRKQETGKADFSMVAQQLAEELGDPDFLDQVSALICAERDEDEKNYEQMYFDTIVTMQQRWLKTEEEKVTRRAREARTAEQIMEVSRQLQELNRLKGELDPMLQRKRMRT